MANPFPFTAGQVLTAAQMNGIGEATSYTPTITNGSVGNGSIVASYVRSNKSVFGIIKFAIGTTSTITGTLQFSLPITAATNPTAPIIGEAYFYDNSTATVYNATTFKSSTTVISFFALNASLTYVVGQPINATTPVIFGAGDEVVCSFTYEAA